MQTLRTLTIALLLLALVPASARAQLAQGVEAVEAEETKEAPTLDTVMERLTAIDGKLDALLASRTSKSVDGLTLGEGLTADTTTEAVAMPAGTKVIRGKVTGTGTVGQVIEIRGTFSQGDTKNSQLLCTLTMGGDGAGEGACKVTANYPFIYGVVIESAGKDAVGTLEIGAP